MIVGLKEKIQELREHQVPEENLQPLVDHANERMKTIVNAITEESLQSFPTGKFKKPGERSSR